jgi:hypothetical protein
MCIHIEDAPGSTVGNLAILCYWFRYRRSQKVEQLDPNARQLSYSAQTSWLGECLGEGSPKILIADQNELMVVSHPLLYLQQVPENYSDVAAGRLSRAVQIPVSGTFTFFLAQS